MIKSLRPVPRTSRLYAPVKVGLGFAWSLSALAIEPHDIQLGNIDLTPTLSSDFSYDDNLFRSSNREVDSGVSLISPRLLGVYTDQVNEYSLELGATKGLYTATSEDDFTAWNLAADAHVEVTSRHLFDFNLRYEDSVQARGTGFSQFDNLPGEPDQYKSRDTSLGYQYGADDSLARLVLEVNNGKLDFTNNQNFVTGRDYTRNGGVGTFYYNVLPRTDILVEARYTEFDYDEAFLSGFGSLPQLDSDELYYFVGVTWEATALTTGSIRIGRADKNFSAPQRPDIDAPSYEVGVEYAPLTYSTLEFSASQNFTEGLGVGDAVKQRAYDVNWQHDWSDRFSSRVQAGYLDMDYQGVNLTDRFNRYSADVTYRFRRWLDFSVGVEREDRDSSGGLFQFDRSVFTIGLEASL